MQLPDLSAEELRDGLASRELIIGREIIFLPSTTSTNSVACGLAEKGQREGAVIIADSQTQGRGRLGRRWISPAGKNLYLSAIIRPALAPADAAVLTLMAAVACVSAIGKASSVPVSIKWPNDLMVSDRKIGGILAEMKTEADSIAYAVIGIGVNINLAAPDFPDDLRTTATSARIETGSLQSRTLHALEIIKALDAWYKVLIRTGKKPIVDSCRSLCSTLGRRVTVASEQAGLTGTAEGIGSDGALVLRLADGTVTKISAGDVTIIKTKVEGQEAVGMRPRAKGKLC